MEINKWNRHFEKCKIHEMLIMFMFRRIRLWNLKGELFIYKRWDSNCSIWFHHLHLQFFIRILLNTKKIKSQNFHYTIPVVLNFFYSGDELELTPKKYADIIFIANYTNYITIFTILFSMHRLRIVTLF